MAAEFDGTNDYIDFGAGFPDNIWNGGGSLAFWVYLDAIGGDYALIMHETALRWFVRIHDVTNELRFSRDWTTTDGAWATPDNSLSTSTWIHIAIVYNDDSTANDAVIYLDGVSQTIDEPSTPAGTRISDATEVFRAGHSTNPLDGKMEDLRAWDTSLTAKQVTRLASGYRGPIGGEVGWWSCDEFEALAHPDGTTLTAGTHYLHDKSVNDNRGNPTNGPVARASDAPRMGIRLD